MRIRPLRLYSHRKAQDERKPGHETQTPRTHGGERREVKKETRQLSKCSLPTTLQASRSGIHSSPGQRTSLEGASGQTSLVGLAQRCQGKSDVAVRLSELISLITRTNEIDSVLLGRSARGQLVCCGEAFTYCVRTAESLMCRLDSSLKFRGGEGVVRRGRVQEVPDVHVHRTR